MSFISLPTGKLDKKPEKKKFKIFPAGYVGRFHRNLTDNVHTFLGSDFYGKTANDANIPSEDVQKYILATSDFAKGMQTNTNHYVTNDRPNNASFRQKLDSIGKNILRRQNPLELVFEDIWCWKSYRWLFAHEIRRREKECCLWLDKKVTGPPGLDFVIQNRLNKLKEGN